MGIQVCVTPWCQIFAENVPSPLSQSRPMGQRARVGSVPPWPVFQHAHFLRRTSGRFLTLSSSRDVSDGLFYSLASACGFP